MYSIPYSCQILKKLEFSQHICGKYSTIFFLKIRPVGAQLLQWGIQTDGQDEAKLMTILRKHLKHLSVVDARYPLCLGELYRGFTAEEIREQNKEEENKTPDIDETPSEKWKFFVQWKREWKF
jgi:hypothetical protein